MKKSVSTHISTFLFIGITLLFNACLDEHPRDQLSEDKLNTTADNLYINTIGNLYHQIGGYNESQGLQGTYRGVYDYNTFSTDEALLPIRGGDWYDGGFWQNLYHHTWSSTDIPLYNTWGYLYNSVSLCNNALYEIDQHKALLTDQQYKEFTAEARGLRALFYFYIMDMWGNVPLVLKGNTPLNEVKQSPRKQVAITLINELLEAIPNLPNVHSNHEGIYYGKFTQPIAYFLLAKILLNHEVYIGDNTMTFNINGHQLPAFQACIACCDKITQAGYTLENNYADNFIVHNENSKENLFTIPMDKNIYPNQYQYLFRSRHYNHGKALGMGSENGPCATISTVRAFGYGTPEKLDTRFKLNFYADTVMVDGDTVRLDNGQPLVYMPLNVAIDLTTSPYIKTAGARMAKYEIDRHSFLDGKLQDNDIVLYRYADVLLMLAEAKVRNGQSGQAEMDAVRARAGMPSRTATLANILEERRLELVWEGWRRQDLIRFGRFTHSYDLRHALEKEDTGYTTIFPIPSRAIGANGNLRPNGDF